jgi:two-component system phosphate regulon sensor histidine kinase PhoR
MLQSIRLRIGLTLALLVLATFLGLATGSLAIAVVVAALAAAILAMVLSGAVLSPLDRIRSTAARVAAGDLEARVSPRPIGEMGEMADAVNQMAASLNEEIAHASRDHSRLLAALSSSTDAVFALNDRDLIAFANPAAERLAQQSQSAMAGKPFAWAVADASIADALRASRQQQQPQELVIEQPNGRFLEAVVTPIIEGGDWSSLFVFHDITNVRRAEQVRRDFVANVSHELRTPLAALKSVVETLQAGALDDPNAAREFLARGDAELDRLVLMVEELLQLSRIESGDARLKRAVLSPDELLSTAVRRMQDAADKHGVQVSLDAPAELPTISGDRDLLERAVVNLIDNAIKFTPNGGSIGVSARSTNGMLLVEVSDNGEGIDPADLPRVFERFFKADRARRAGGTGLGLAIVKHTIEAHGGSVGVRSQLGQGSTFTFSLPAGE